MPIPGSGQVSLNDIATEFGGDAPHALSEYHGKGNAPSSGEIQIAADFYGADNTPPDPQTLTGAGTTNITIADNVLAIGVQIVGAGGGGAGGGGMFNFAGGGGGAGGNVIAYHNVSAGQTVSAIRGSGGSGGMFVPNPNRSGDGSSGQNSSVTLAGTTIATGNGGVRGRTEGSNAGGSGGGTSTGGSVYNVTANTGNSGANGSATMSTMIGGTGGSSPVSAGGQGRQNNTGLPGSNGSGGGGAGSNMGIRNGGPGGAGYIKVTFYTSSNPPADLSF